MADSALESDTASSASEFSEFSESEQSDTDQNSSESDDQNSDSSDEGLEARFPWFRIHGEEIDRDDPYPFMEAVGPNNMPHPNSPPVVYFLLLFTLHLIQMFVTETNAYARYFLDNAVLRRRSLARKWVATCVTEMKAFVSVILNMGLIRKPSIKSYWSKASSQRTPWFGEVMCRDRFELLLTFFHMVDSTNLPRPGQAGYDPCARFEPIVEHANNQFRHHYTPHREICVDESRIGTKSRTQLIQYLPNKHHHKWGIKLFMLSDSVTSYLFGFLVYKGKRGNDQQGNAGRGLAHRVVMRLLNLDNYLRKGYHLFVDNFFTSFPLINELAESLTHLTGTVRHNKRELPRGLKAEINPGVTLNYRQGGKLATA